MMFMRIKKSALRDVVRDTRFPLQVNIRYKEEEKQSRLFYPEYYEEAVEIHQQELWRHIFMEQDINIAKVFCEERSTIVNMMTIFPVASSSGRSGYCMGDISWAYVNAIRGIRFCMDAIRGLCKAEPM